VLEFARNGFSRTSRTRLMIDKLHGLVLIINTLLPGVFLILVLGSGVFLWRALERDIVPRIEEISGGFDSLKTAAEDAAGTVKEIVGKAGESASEATAHAEEAMETLSPIAARAASLRNSVATVINPIAGVEVVVPSIKVTKREFEFKKTYDVIGKIHIGPVKYVSGSTLSLKRTSPFASLRTPFDDIALALDTVSEEVENARAGATDAAKEIAKLGPLVQTFMAFRDQFENARTALDGLSDALRSTLRPIAWTFGIFALLAFPWLAVSYFTWSLVRLNRGYALLTGP
jgi:methyl-accepting chemotaxis protein